MKKLSALLISMAMGVACVNAETTVVYLNDGGDAGNDGLTPQTAVSSLTSAFNLIPVDNDGVIVINGKFTQSANFIPTVARTGAITFTQVYGGVDYRGTDHDANAWTLTKGVRIGLSTDTRFENVTFNLTAAKSGFALVICNYHKLTIGDGCEMHGNFTWSGIGSSFSILGGCQDNDKLAPKLLNPDITMQSGTAYIAAFNRGTASNFTRNSEVVSGKATINISGGYVHFLAAGSHSKGLKGGSAEINISGGSVNRAYVGTNGDYSVDGERVTVNVSGGSYPLHRVFNITNPEADTDTEFELNISNLTAEAQSNLLEYTLTKDFTRISADILIPEREFKAGTYTLADGTEVKYRYHIPEAGTTGTKHLVLFLHDAGSRGDDNALHVCSMGASPLYPMLNGNDNTIFVAPQVPEEERWITLTGGFKFASEGTKWLEGAVEKAKQMATEAGVAPENMYVVGSSNGAAAIWYLLNRPHPEFAKATAIAGYGEENPDTDELIANVSKSKLWAFHGTEDATVLIGGMQVLAPKLTAAADGRFRYTEYDGATHATIYNLAAHTPGFADFFFADGGSTGIESTDIGNPFSVSAGAGTVTVSSVSGTVGLFNASGMAVAKAEAEDGEVCFSGLQAGLYIVSPECGEAAKVMVR